MGGWACLAAVLPRDVGCAGSCCAASCGVCVNTSHVSYTMGCADQTCGFSCRGVWISTPQQLSNAELASLTLIAASSPHGCPHCGYLPLTTSLHWPPMSSPLTPVPRHVHAQGR